MDYLDANILWDWVGEGKYTEYLERESKRGNLCTSVHVLMEMRLSMLRSGLKVQELNKFHKLIVGMTGLIFIDLDEADYLLSLELAERSNLTPYDSMHAAVCLNNGFVLSSMDKDFKKISGLKTIQPKA